MSVYNQDSELVDVLSKDPAGLEDISAALAFVDVDFEICLSIKNVVNE